MSLWKIAWRSIRQRALSSALTAISIALGVALVAAVMVIHAVIKQSFSRGAQGYDLIVGAKGDPFLLVLNTVFYMNLQQRIDTVSYAEYEKLTQGRLSAAVRTAIPICTGHDYQGCAAVATVPEMFTDLRYFGDREYHFAQGRNFRADQPFEAVIGSTAARKTGLRVGDKFRPVASGPAGADHADHADEEFTVVGILAPTGTPNDRAIFMNLEGFFLCPAHLPRPSPVTDFFRGDEKTAPLAPQAVTPTEKPAADNPATDKSPTASPPLADKAPPRDHACEHEHDDPDCACEDHHDHAGHDHATRHHAQNHDHQHRQFTAILVCTDMSRPQLAMGLFSALNQSKHIQAVRPVEVIALLLDKLVGRAEILLLVVAVLVVIVASISILVGIYNSMADRRHEIAVMRALGASRLLIMTVILLESIMLALGGGVLGVILGHGLIGALSSTIADWTGITVGMFDFQLVEMVLLPGLIVLATLVGLLPAVVAYRTDVVKSLAPRA
jgi:putative ABC transport system permease protein